MNYLKIASAALAAFVMVGCGGDKDACCDKKDTACGQSVKVSPAYVASTEGAALIEPQAVIRTALAVFDKVKAGLPEADVKEAEEDIAFVKKYGIEDISWVSVSVSGDSGAVAAYYPRSFEETLKAVAEKDEKTYETIEVSGKPAFKFDGMIFAQVDKIVVAAAEQDILAEQIKLYTEGGANAAFTDLAPSANGILTVKIPSLGKALARVDGLVPLSDANVLLPDAERMLKECGEFVVKVTTDGAEISVVAGSVTDAQTIKTALDSVIMMGKMAYEENKDQTVEAMPPAVKEQLPAIDAAVKSLACTQQGKKVSLSVKAEILKLAEAIAPAVLESM